MRLLPLLLSMAMIASFGCEKKNEESNSSESDTDDSSETGTIEVGENPATDLKLTEVTPIVLESTPKSLQAETAGTVAISSELALAANTGYIELNFDDPETQCAQGGQYDMFTECGDDGDLTEREACNFIVDIRCRLYHKGPTEIKEMVKKLDETISDATRGSDGKYIPCADPDHEDYKLVEFSAKFDDLKDRDGTAQPLDLGFKYHLSCLKSNTGFGNRTDGDGGLWKYYTYAQTKSESAMGSVAVIDPDENVDFWTSLPEDGTATEYNPDAFSTGLIHVKVAKATKIYQMTFTGVGVGPGCGVAVMSNGTYMFARANLNGDQRCTATSTLPFEGDDFSTDKSQVDFCLKVNDSTKISSVDMTNCTDANLNADTLTIGILSRDKLEAFNASKIFSKVPEGVNKFTSEAASGPAE